jgi:hypothetical protein
VRIGSSYILSEKIIFATLSALQTFTPMLLQTHSSTGMPAGKGSCPGSSRHQFRRLSSRPAWMQLGMCDIHHKKTVRCSSPGMFKPQA